MSDNTYTVKPSAGLTRRHLLRRGAAASAIAIAGGMSWRVPVASAECADQLLVCTDDRLRTYAALVGALSCSSLSPLTGGDAQKAPGRLQALYAGEDFYRIAVASLTLDNLRQLVPTTERARAARFLSHLRRWSGVTSAPMLVRQDPDLRRPDVVRQAMLANGGPLQDPSPRPRPDAPPVGVGLRLNDSERALQSLFRAAVLIAEQPQPSAAAVDTRYIIDAR